MLRTFAIIAPCFNEKEVIAHFLSELESTLTDTDCTFYVVIVDDYSTDSTKEILQSFEFTDSDKFELKVIRLKYNMGHQEAIRQGIIYTSQIDLLFEGVFVMDSDGEDDPLAIKQMIQKEGNYDIVFFERGKRFESSGFKIGYFLYKFFFNLITGKRITFGNYSLVSQEVLNAISHQRFFHYSGFLSKQKFRIEKIRFDRRKRIDGNSKMNFKSLIFHGLYSIIEYSEEILFSFIKLFTLILFALLGIGCYVIYSKFIAFSAISGWASTISFNLITLGFIIISTVIISLLLIGIKKTILQQNIDYDKIR